MHCLLDRLEHMALNDLLCAQGIPNGELHIAPFPLRWSAEGEDAIATVVEVV